MTDTDIILLASAPWETTGRLNCHHVATRLARRNRVLFVESPGLRTPSPFHAADLRKIAGRVGRWLRHGLARASVEASGVHVLSPAVIPGQGIPAVARWNNELTARHVARAALRLGFSRPLLWTFLPLSPGPLMRMKHSGLIYHCVDRIGANPGVHAAFIETQERELVRAADLCFATSAPLARRLRRMGARVRCVPNVAETERFMTPVPCPDELRDVPRPRIGTVGNLASYKMDFEMLARLATDRPDWSLVLVGPTGQGDPRTDLRTLRKLPNVHFAGPQPPRRIPAFVHAFDACLIPFRRSEVTNGSLPLKTFEYLAAGKPALAAPLDALKAEPLDDVIVYADGAEQTINAVEMCLSNDSDLLRERRRRVAQRYSWSVRFPQITEAVERQASGLRLEGSGTTKRQA